ncbi:MAG: OmpA family protein [Deltaproteobacteria bacterium]
MPQRNQIGRGKLCDLPDTRAEAIRFATNDTGLRRRGRHILNDIVACIRVGLIRGGSLLVTGYADARGDVPSNRRLALARAREVERYLLDRGVPSMLIAIARGEESHMGTGPELWALHRRVEISWSPQRAELAGEPSD